MDVFPACCIWHFSGSNAGGIDTKTGCCNSSSCWGICEPWGLLLLPGVTSELCLVAAQGEDNTTATLLVRSVGENCRINRLILFSCTSFPCGLHVHPFIGTEIVIWVADVWEASWSLYQGVFMCSCILLPLSPSGPSCEGGSPSIFLFTTVEKLF